MSTRFTDIAGSILIPGIIPTGNLLWVDAVNGNDSLAVRGRLSVPFKTLTAAKNAAQIGDTIVVLPGTYTDQNLAKTGVNWHFLCGALVQSPSTTSIFSVTTAMGFNVTGKGRFTHEGNYYVLESTNSGSNIYFECHEMYATKTSIRMTNGTKVVVEADSIRSDELSSIDVSGGTLHVKAREISSELVYALNATGGTVDVEAYRMYSNATEAIYFSAGTANVTAFEVSSIGTQAVKYDSAYSNVLTLKNARIVSKATPSSGNYKPALMITANGGKLRIVNCTFIGVNNGAGIPRSIDTTLGSSTTVLLYGLSVANFIKADYVSLNTSLFVVDSTFA